MKNLLCAVVCCLTLMGCSNSDNDGQQICNEFELESGDYSLQAENFLIDEIARNYYNDQGEKYIHVYQNTQDVERTIPDIRSYLDLNEIAYEESTVANYELSNLAFSFFQKDSQSDKIRLISVNEYECLIDRDRDDRWANFKNKYPNSIAVFTFSKPGFNDDGNIAIISYEYLFPYINLGNYGLYLAILERTDDGWELIEDIPIILS